MRAAAAPLGGSRGGAGMSFLRHGEIYRSDGWVKSGSGEVAAPCLIVSMSLRLAIPWPVALQQSRPPLHQPGPLCPQPPGSTMIFQRMAKAGLTACLSLGVHSSKAEPWVEWQTRQAPAGAQENAAGAPLNNRATDFLRPASGWAKTLTGERGYPLAWTIRYMLWSDLALPPTS